ncbi:MAG: hypothetical protein JXD23_06560 [Spirochaetales bacterium]|nr:hypothetical protein [Spirochaetales bacterium]
MKKTARQGGIAVLGFLAMTALFMSCGGVIPTGDSSAEQAATETATLQVRLGNLENLTGGSLALTSSNLTVTLRNADLAGEPVTQTVWEKPEELCLEAGASYFPPVAKYVSLPENGDNLEIELVFSGRCPYNDEKGEVRGNYIVPIADIGPGINSNSTSDGVSSRKIYFKGTVFPPSVPLPIVPQLPPLHKVCFIAPTNVLGIYVEIALLN